MAHGPNGHHGLSGSDLSDPDSRGESVPPELPAMERNRNRVWRAMSWVLLANALLFWLMTCVTAFARATAT